MTVLVDAGNSRIKWAACDRTGLGAVHGAAVAPEGAAGAVVERILSARPDEVVISSVRGRAFEQQLLVAAAGAGIGVRFVRTPASGHGVDVAYADPSRLGVDRFLAMVAAHAARPGPVVVVDCGTAVTIDAVGAGGGHLGGLILPGLKLMRESLVTGSAGIELDAGDAGEDALFARDTGPGVHSGTLRALTAAVETICGDMAAGMGGQASIVITGGAGPVIRKRLRIATELEPDLVLRGLALIVDRCP